jgi:riboflavin biosynthesis pyrimidine reductase
MSEVPWHIAMSLDGCIAGSSEDMTWMRDHFGRNRSVDEVLEQIDAALAATETRRRLVISTSRAVRRSRSRVALR